MTNASSSSQSTEKFLTEEREEVMVSEKGHSLQKAHFLKPIVTSIDGAGVAELPRQRLSVSSSELLNRMPSQVSFCGFWFAERHFLSWLGKMETLHGPIWRKAGIFEAIKASTYNITKNQCLILSVAEKWCPETKSFVFPWGEATVTLEDVMVLLGFSVLGSPVFAPSVSSETKDAIDKLEKAKQENTSKDGRLSERSWISCFLGRDDLEHEAFLALWLSLYVFPYTSRRCISRNVFSIAVLLARGERIALAPAVLASIYRDLGRISGLAREKCDDKVNLKSLFKLVQVWTWERFKNLRPKAREIPKGEPRIAQWDHLQQKSENVRLRFHDFDWRPYAKPLKNWNPRQFYVEEAMWVTVDLDDEFASFARCVRVSQLAGDGFVDNYYPNRVAMQFGLAQDLPALVTRHSNFTEKEAWDDYSKSLAGLKLYMPSCLTLGSVTARYRDWWLKSVSEILDSEEMQKEPTETFEARNTFNGDDDDDLEVSPKVLPLSEVVAKLTDGSTKRRRYKMRRSAKKDETRELVNGHASSGWKMRKTNEDLKNMRSNYRPVQMKRAHEDDEESSADEEDDDNMTIAQRIRSSKKYSDSEKSGGKASESREKRIRKFVVDSDEEVDVNGNCAKEKSDDGTKKPECWLHEDEEKKRCNEKRKEDVFERLKHRNIVIKEIGLKLKARIMKVEKTLAMMRESKTRGNQIKK